MASKLVSMEKDDDDVLDHIAVNPILDSKFPYHMRFSLTHKEFDKLKCDPTVAVKGAEVEFSGVARILNVDHHDGEGGKTHRVEFQIEKFCLECEDEETEEHEEEE